jgi:hypothetical protein
MPKNEEMLGVIFDSDPEQPTIDSENSVYYIPFYKNEEYFDVYDNYVNFIKSCESLVRKHTFYKTYINYLINIVGMKTCQVLPNIEVDETGKGPITIEMHHGPILTLFDTCEIVLNHLRHQNCKDITTFKVANMVIEEHRLNNVRVMLLAKSVHQKVHDDSIMLNYKMGFGNTFEFLRKYSDGVDRAMRKNINDYIRWSMDNDSFDNDVLAISEHMKKYDNDFDSYDDTVADY